MDVPISHPAEEGRPATPLSAHLEDVGERAEGLVPAGLFTLDGRSLGEFCRVLGRCHDIGKATTWFQQHVDPGCDEPDGPHTHSLFGAFVTYYALDRLGFGAEDCLVGFVAVARHHGRLPDTASYLDGQVRWNPRNPGANVEQRKVLRQIKNVDDSRREYADDFVDDITQGRGSWDEFVSLAGTSDIFDMVYEHVSERSFTDDRPEPSDEFYDTLLQAWSALVLADKTSAAGLPVAHLETNVPETDTLVSHIERLQQNAPTSGMEGQLNEARATARNDVVEGVDRFLRSDRNLATLTLPTGLGKTMSGLNAAFEIRDQIGGSRIVYALPFTSIIDQVAAETMDIFDADVRDERLTIHHHLAETATELDLDDPTDERAQLEAMVAESWRSGLTITTFVQLFESLAGPRNTQSMKLPSLYDSVVLLDEPQALPMDWWKLVRRLVDLLTDRYDATVISMTATQPALIDDAVELVENPQEYFSRFERVRYRVDPSVNAFDEGNPLEYNNAAEAIIDGITGDSTSVLSVCNTIDSSQTLADTIRDRASTVSIGEYYDRWLETDQGMSNLLNDIESAVSEETFALAQLTTRHRPIDRRRIIDVLKRLTERDVPTVAVSTQLIEAGVDISFDQVYRDLAPMDSVVQAAGRCNRSFGQSSGTVVLWWLAPPGDSDTTPSQAVYDRSGVSAVSLTTQTIEEIDDGRGEIAESEMTTAGVRDYYDRVANRDPGDPEYVDILEAADANSLGQISLIDQRQSIDVVVCRSEGDRRLVREIQLAWNDRDYDELDTLLDEVQEITVSIPVYDAASEEADALLRLDPLFPEENNDRRLLDTRRTRFTSYFDPDTGLVIPDSTAEARIL